MDRIRELIAKLEEAINEEFPEMTDANVTVNEDGYARIEVMKWAKDENGTVGETPRRVLWMQSKHSNKWQNDITKAMNDYYEERGVLMEG